MRFDNIGARVVDQIEDTIELPRTRTPRVFMDKVSSNPELMSVQCHATFNVLRRLLLSLLKRLQPFLIVAMHIFIKFLQIAKSSTRGGTNDYKGHRCLYEFPSTIPIRGEAEVPTIREVERGAWQ